MARLSRLLPPWQTCSPRIDEPGLVVTGASPAWEAGWAGVSKVLPRFWASKDGDGRDLVKRVGLHQGLDPGGGIGPLSVQGDELARRAGRHRAGRVGFGAGRCQVGDASHGQCG